MKTPFLLAALRHGLLLLLLACTLHALPGRAQTPQLMTYQGYLTDQNGTALGTNGPQNYDIVFRIWNQPTGGAAPLYGELQTVTVVNGYFSALLGQGSPYVNAGVTDPHPPLSVVFTTNNVVSTARYVEMTVKGLNSGADVTILPRLQLVSAPYAFMSASASALVSSTTGNNLITSSGNNVTINGSLTNSGGSIYLDNSQLIYAKNSGGVYEQCFYPRYSDNITYLNYGSAGFNIRNNSSVSTMWMANNGLVGIGTTSPSATLDVNGSFHANSETITGGALISGGYVTLDNSLDNSAGNVGIGTGGYNNVKLRVSTTEAYGIFVDPGATVAAAYFNGNTVGTGTASFGGGVAVNGTSNPYLSVGDGSSELDMGLASGFGGWSSGASPHDAVVRNTTGKLILQSGSGSPGIAITTGNAIGIGTSSPGAAIDLEHAPNTGLAQDWLFEFNVPGDSNGSGVLWSRTFAAGGAYNLELCQGQAYKPGGGSWGVFSDIRLKKDVRNLDGALDSLLSLRSVTFEYKDPASIHERPGRHTGFVAQEVEKTFPEWVSEGPDGMKTVAPVGFESLTVQALRELRTEKDAQIQTLRDQNTALEKRLKELEQSVKALTQPK